MTRTAGRAFSLETLVTDRAWAERLARHLVGHADAEDLVQEGWMAALRAGPAEREGLRPWLTEVLRRAASNRRRGERRRQAREDTVAAAQTEREVPSPEELVARMQTQRLLAELVLALEGPIREVVLLRYFENLSGAEIAKALGTPEGTVRWRLKAGVDELRRRLDERHEGRAHEWMRALLPLGALRSERPRGERARPGTGPRAWTGAGLLAGVTGLVLAVAYWTGQHAPSGGAQSPPGDGRGDGEGFEASRGRGGGRPERLGVALTGTSVKSSDCQAQLAAVRGELAAVEPEYIAVAPARLLFEEGAPNPAAEAELAPVVTRLMKGDAGAAPDFVLECRTWACLLKVLQPTGGNADAWMRPLQSDHDLQSRIRGLGFQSGTLTRDPVSGTDLSEQLVRFSLLAPAARPNPRARFAGRSWRPEISGAEIRTTGETDCQNVLEANRRRLDRLRAVIEAQVPIPLRWEQGQKNENLTREVSELVRTGLGQAPDDASLFVDCRAQICQVGTRAGTVVDDRIHRVLGPRSFSVVSTGRGNVYFLMPPPGASLGADLGGRIFDEFLASPELSACELRHAPSGGARLQIQVPRSGEKNLGGQEARVFTRVGGELAGTPFATCLESVLESVVLRHPLPENVTGATLQKRLEFPRGASR